MLLLGYYSYKDIIWQMILDRPKKNYIKMLVAGNEKLRFEAIMLSSNDADSNRKFIISIRLSDDMIGNGSEKLRSKSVISEFIDVSWD